MTGLRLAADLVLPVDAATQTFLIVGKRGSGKTSTCVRLAEQLHHAGSPFVVVDPVDSWWGLKASRDGKGPGLDVYVFGGRHADLPLESTAGALMADILVDHRISAVLSVKHFSGRERARFVSDFAERLFKRNSAPLHLFLEEAHETAPQQPMAGEEEMVGRVTRIWKLGRSSGLGGSAVTQRPASLSKNITTQAEILVVHRTIGPQDVAAVREWIKYHGQREEILPELSTLKTGEAFVWSPDFPEGRPIGLRRVTMLPRETFDSSATPKAGEGPKEPRELAPVDLDVVRSQMAATIERAKADDPKELRKRIAELEKRLAAPAPATKVERVEVHVLAPTLVDRLEESIRGLRVAVDDISAALAKAVHTRTAAPPAPVRQVAQVRRSEPKVVHPSEGASDSKLGKAERSILSVLAQYPAGRTKRQVALLAGYAINGGGFGNALSRLRSTGLIDGSELLSITDAGLSAGIGFEPLPMGQALLDHWMRQLDHAESEILRVLTEVHPKALTKEEVASRTTSARGGPYDPAGGGFGNALSRLRTLELIEGRGELRASDDLFGGVA